MHPCKTLGKQLKHPCFRRSPNASLRSFVGFASCKTSVRTLSSILAWSQGASLSALRLIFKSSAFEPPIIAQHGCRACMPKGSARCRAHQAYTTLHRGEGRQGCLKVNAQSASGRCATERSQRFRGWGLRVFSIFYIKDFFYKLKLKTVFFYSFIFISNTERN